MVHKKKYVNLVHKVINVTDDGVSTFAQFEHGPTFVQSSQKPKYSIEFN
jgi:hypothetical protein